MFVPSEDPDSIDDIDIMGVYVAPLNHYLGFTAAKTKDVMLNEWDAVSYELRHFIGMLLGANPNVYPLLWMPNEHFIYSNELGNELRNNRNLFVTKKAYHSFKGYATGQRKRMLRFNQEAKEELELRRQELKTLGVDFNVDEPILPPGVQKSVEEKVKQYKALYSKYFSGYMGAKRKRLVEQFGFDTKNAAHSIRLLRMACEFLQTGELVVDRSSVDAAELLSIKKGGWTLEECQEEADRLFEVLTAFYERSQLPEEPDYKLAEELCVRLIAKANNLSGFESFYVKSGNG